MKKIARFGIVRKLSDNSEYSDNLKYHATKKTREIDDFWPSRVFFCINTWVFNIKKNQIDIIQGKKWRRERFWHIFPAMFFWYKIHDSSHCKIRAKTRMYIHTDFCIFEVEKSQKIGKSKNKASFYARFGLL